MTEIILYQFEECPWCEKVRQKLKELKLDYKKVNMIRDREDSERKEIYRKSGVPTVPVINIDGKFIGDSAKIIEFLDEKFS
ncbi:MAG: glutathione S-transferase N-terminal domain-containing protein [Nanoarchaeota archaeon]